jgi:hypothetical protein
LNRSSDNCADHDISHTDVNTDFNNKQPNTNNDFKICVWNIEGLNEEKVKVLSPMLNSFDIIALSETWLYPNDSVDIPNYKNWDYQRLEIHPNAKRNSGGSLSMSRRLGCHI